jgi:hypothetical protein
MDKSVEYPEYLAEENILGNIRIELVVPLCKKRSGLPANIYLDNTGSWSRSGYWRIIKFQPNTEDHPVTRGMVPMSIEDDPQILDENAKIALTTEQIEQIKAFVQANKDLLLQLADAEIDTFEFFEKMTVIVNDPGAYMTEEENLLENRSIEFMTTLRQSMTGLSTNLFLDDTASWSKFGCWRIIKFQPNTEYRSVNIDRVPMSIEDDPQILDKNIKIELNAEQIEQIKAFVRTNEYLLLLLADAEIDIFEFIKSMVKV